MPRNEYVVVSLVKPVLGADPDDGVEFTSDRHKVPARWARQDPTETVFIDDLGVIVGRWSLTDVGDPAYQMARRGTRSRRQGGPQRTVGRQA